MYSSQYLIHIEKRYILGIHVQYVSIGYRCPNCNDVNSINVNKIYNGRLMFVCSKCSICGIVPSMAEQDEAYLEFLSMYDNGHVDKVQDLESVIEQERLVRPFSEIKELIRKNGAVGNKLLENVLKSKKDYIVDFIVLEEPEPEVGREFQFLNIDEGIVTSLCQAKYPKTLQVSGGIDSPNIRGKGCCYCCTDGLW